MHDDGDPLARAVAAAAGLVEDAARGWANLTRKAASDALKGAATATAAVLAVATWPDRQSLLVAGVANRATQIAQAEGTSLLAATAGQVVQKVWRTRQDDRVRESHQLAEGQVRQVGQTFEVGGAALRWPGDPLGPPGETINCRCRLTYQLGRPPG